MQWFWERNKTYKVVQYYHETLSSFSVCKDDYLRHLSICYHNRIPDLKLKKKTKNSSWSRLSKNQHIP